MPWTTLSAGLANSRYANTPAILAGPILRRVEKDTVSVWLALKKSAYPDLAKITLTVYSNYVNASSNTQMLEGYYNITTSPALFGQDLIICVVTANTGTQLQEGVTYWYDLDLAKADGSFITNLAGGLTSSSYSIDLSYDGTGLPSFSLPPSNPADLRVIHGSCRKPQGGMSDEKLDGLYGVHTMLDQSHQAAAATSTPNAQWAVKRPHLLFLTGDQIYSDDVSDIMLYMLRDLIGGDAPNQDNGLFMGWNEDLAGIDTSVGTILNSPINADILRPSQRKRLQNVMNSDDGQVGWDLSGLTSSTHKSHLMKLGEFYGMYLFCWSDVLWPAQLPDYNLVYQGLHDSSNKVKKKQLLSPKKFAKESTLLWSFKQTLKDVRKALANIPTYMICDDHEITDDWNLSKNWVENIYSKPLGKRAIQNALSAYILFQGWGNNPAHFTSSQQPLLNALKTLVTNHSNTAFDSVGTLLLPTIQAISGGEHCLTSNIEWHINLKFNNNYQFLVLNTRTNRLFPAGSDTGFVGLMSPDALNTQLQNILQQDILTFIISPAPVFGSAALDRLSMHMIDEIGEKAKLDNDAEFWNFNKKYFEKFLAKISFFSSAILLGGDVHFGLSRHVTYWNYRTGANGKKSHFASFVSSALKNCGIKERMVSLIDKTSVLPMLLDSPVAGTLLTIVQPAFEPQDEPYKVLLPPSYTEDIFAWDTPGVNITTTTNMDKLVLSKGDNPAIFSNVHDPKNNFVWKSYKVKFPAAPHWYYRVRPVKDTRNDADRNIDAAAAGVYNNPVLSVFPLTLANTLKKKINFSRNNQIVGVNHVAEINIIWDSTNMKATGAVQKFWFVPTGTANQTTKMGNYTNHLIMFDTPDAEGPEPGNYI